MIGHALDIHDMSQNEDSPCWWARLETPNFKTVAEGFNAINAEGKKEITNTSFGVIMKKYKDNWSALLPFLKDLNTRIEASIETLDAPLRTLLEVHQSFLRSRARDASVKKAKAKAKGKAKPKAKAN